jgi:hypothetical protein
MSGRRPVCGRHKRLLALGSGCLLSPGRERCPRQRDAIRRGRGRTGPACEAWLPSSRPSLGPSPVLAPRAQGGPAAGRKMDEHRNWKPKGKLPSEPEQLSRPAGPGSPGSAQTRRQEVEPGGHLAGLSGAGQGRSGRGRSSSSQLSPNPGHLWPNLG